MTLKQKTDELYRIKQDIKAALIEKGYTAAQVGDIFSTYADLIRNLNAGGGDVQSITDALMLTNGKYIKLTNGKYLKLRSGSSIPTNPATNALMLTNGKHVELTNGKYLRIHK